MTLKEKLKQDKQVQEKNGTNWAETKDEWILAVNQLNATITAWFKDYEVDGLVNFSFVTKTIQEEYIGSYEINSLHMSFSNGREIIIEPIGRLIIGARGRLDIYARGYNSGKYYILMQKDAENTLYWEIVNAQVTRDVKHLTKEHIEEIIEQWLL